MKVETGPIRFDETTGIFQIDTANSSYQMKVNEYKDLIHTYYGKKIDMDDLYGDLCMLDRGFSGNPHDVGKYDRTYSLDILPQEYSCFGTGDYRITGLHVREVNGARVAGLKYEGYEIHEGLMGIPGLPAVYDGEDIKTSGSATAAVHEGQRQAAGRDAATGGHCTLSIFLRDPVNNLSVELRYGVLEELDIITRNVVIGNEGAETVYLEKAASMNLDLPYAGDYDFVTFYGRHAMERNLSRREIHHGVQSVGSVRGTSSHQYNPFSMLCERGATETTGACYGFSFVYSGEFLMEVEKDQADQVRFLCGIHPDDFTWVLQPKEAFATPQVIMSYSDYGFSKLSRNFHHVIAEHIVRGDWKHKMRPVLINNWEATFFDFTGEKLIGIAKEARELGVDMFVMDDGWFGARDSDNAGLGDWFANEKKLGCSLKELGERIEALGMQFGLWVEPEMVNEDSDLYRAHPEWALTAPGRQPQLGRNQIVLDMSREDVCDYILSRLTDILSSAPISYVKWDMNRSIADKYSHAADSARQGEVAHRYVLGVYRILESIHQRFPHVLFEGCSGGGGRFDAGMLYYTPQIWCSDNTDAIGRYGTSFCYPVSTMGAHVSVVPNQQTGRTSPLSTRATVAMAGTFGYELDITKMTDGEKEAVKSEIRFFKKHYALMHEGDYYRLSIHENAGSRVAGCDELFTAWEMAAADGSEALVSVVYHGVEANSAPVHLRVAGLDPSKKYLVQYVGDTGASVEAKYQGHVYSGRTLANAGFTIAPAKEEFGSWQIYISEV